MSDRLSSSDDLSVKSLAQGVSSYLLPTLAGFGHRYHDVAAVEGSREDVQLGRHSRLAEALCVLDVLIDKEIEVTHDYEGRGQTRQVFGSGR